MNQSVERFYMIVNCNVLPCFSIFIHRINVQRTIESNEPSKTWSLKRRDWPSFMLHRIMKTILLYFLKIKNFCASSFFFFAISKLELINYLFLYFFCVVHDLSEFCTELDLPLLCYYSLYARTVPFGFSKF